MKNMSLPYLLLEPVSACNLRCPMFPLIKHLQGNPI